MRMCDFHHTHYASVSVREEGLYCPEEELLESLL